MAIDRKAVSRVNLPWGAPTEVVQPRTTELIATLSLALDLASGQPAGHALRTSLIGLRIAGELGLDDEHKTGLYLGMLVKDAGCASSASEIFGFFGSDEIAAQRVSRIIDWNDMFEVAKYAAAIHPRGSIITRARSVLQLTRHHAGAVRTLTRARSDAASHIVRKLGLGNSADECVCALDERWDGSGGPRGLSQYGIPLMARIAAVAQALDVLSCAYNLEAAYEILAKRSGAMYDPEAVKAALSLRGDARFWDRVRKQPRSTLLSVDLPINKQVAEVKEVNAICESYAAVIDAKSSYTNQHSLRVRQYAVEIGKALGLPFESLHTLSQAALLHDVGKLSVPNTILEKPNALTEQEWIRVRRYPAHTHGILKRISGFERLTRIACTHNERLNGTGYFQGLSANKLDLEMRIIAVADVFDALSTDRPHREALSLKRILRLLDAQSEVSLDGACIDVLKSKYCYHTLAELSGRRRPAQHAA